MVRLKILGKWKVGTNAFKRHWWDFFLKPWIVSWNLFSSRPGLVGPGDADSQCITAFRSPWLTLTPLGRLGQWERCLVLANSPTSLSRLYQPSFEQPRRTPPPSDTLSGYSYLFEASCLRGWLRPQIIRYHSLVCWLGRNGAPPALIVLCHSRCLLHSQAALRLPGVASRRGATPISGDTSGILHGAVPWVDQIS